MPAHKSVTVPYEVRPLTPADIAPTGQLANAYRYGTTDQDINPYPILYPELRKLQQAGKKLITITVRRQLNPLFFLEDFDNLQGVTWNHEDKTVTIPVRTLTQFVGGYVKRDSVPETRVFLMGGTRFNMATTHKTTFYGWCFFRGDNIVPEGRFEHVYLDGTMTLPSPVKYFYKVTIISEAPSDLRGLYEADRVTIKGTANITGKVSLWRYILGGNIAIDCELTRTDAELFGADSAVTTEGSPLMFSESLYPLDEDATLLDEPYNNKAERPNLRYMELATTYHGSAKQYHVSYVKTRKGTMFQIDSTRGDLNTRSVTFCARKDWAERPEDQDIQ